jgi:hypothetical protein
MAAENVAVSQGGRVNEFPEAAYITLESANPKLSVSAILAEDMPNVTGFGGWVEVVRPRRVNFVDWQGQSPKRLSFGMMLDVWGDGPLTVEQDCRDLERMASAGPQHQRPPTVRITEGQMPHMDVSWVIDTLTWGDCIRQRETGKRVRQVVSLVLVAVSDPYASAKSPAAANRAARPSRGGMAHAPTYRVKTNTETLSAIAASQYGDASKWHDIAKANNIRDPKHLKQGQLLKLP